MICLFLSLANLLSDIESRHSSDVDRLISWFRSNFLMLNVSKTKIMLIGTHQRLNAVDSFSVVADTSLERVDTFNYYYVAKTVFAMQLVNLRSVTCYTDQNLKSKKLI